MKVELINYMHNPVETMAFAVSKCYDSEPKESVVRGCIKKKHDSVTEHSYFTFNVSQVSRSFLQQVVRHRHLSFTVRSGRYTNAFSEKIEFLELPEDNGVRNSVLQKLSDNQEEYIVKKYEEGYASYDIGKRLSLNASTICNIINRRTVNGANRRYTINHNLFDDINNSDTAYLLGFIISDGCVSKNNQGKYILNISQNIIETELMRKINLIFKNTSDISKPSKTDVLTVTTTSEKIYNKLTSLGITPNKSLSFKIDNVVSELNHVYHKDLIRGIFEGDGHLFINTKNNRKSFEFGITGTESLCLFIRDYLCSVLGMNETKLSNTKNNITKRVRFSGRNNVLKIINYLYSGINTDLICFKKMYQIKEINEELFYFLYNQVYDSIYNRYKCIIPPSISENLEALNIFINSVDHAKTAYINLLKWGVKKEDARFVLPECIATEMVVSGNYRAWMKFCELRLDKHAQWEIRSFAKEVDRLIHEVTSLPKFETEE